MAKKGGLGKGLNALFLDNEAEESGTLMRLRLSDVEPVATLSGDVPFNCWMACRTAPHPVRLTNNPSAVTTEVTARGPNRFIPLHPIR